MSARTITFWFAALLAAALAVPSTASAEPPSVTPVMKKAFDQLEQGPDQLRRYVFRTRMIYELDYAQVVKAYEAAHGTQAAAASEPPRVAAASPETR